MASLGLITPLKDLLLNRDLFWALGSTTEPSTLYHIIMALIPLKTVAVLCLFSFGSPGDDTVRPQHKMDGTGSLEREAE